ncbi:hypothetical protein BKA67DRAFT_664290 [Truncatella angustata]|uniref:Uncharacterized protein n=1 Tax=Truncatella angustata TaxID=152316 RepID=A0A9P8RIE9_9PEZI|nr:uncharacterized protein BKA67DRAFT_664290 [Truncatella angustata]KAH6646452.1 hypothetical protein BKA67DRAFT_664290 [Truncatella angustata]
MPMSGDSPSTSSHSTSSVRATSGVGKPVTAGIATEMAGPSTGTTMTTVAAASLPTTPSTTIVTSGLVGFSPSSTTATSSESKNAGPATTTTAQASNVSSSGLPRSAIAGISVGVAIGALGLLLALFLLYRCRCRKVAKRMPPYQNNLRGEFDDKNVGNRAQASEGNRHGDVFAPFGGRASSFESAGALNPGSPSTYRSTKSQNDVAATASYPSSPADSYYLSPLSPPGTGVPLLKGPAAKDDDATAKENKSDEPAQLDSRPLHFELYSANAEKQMAELPTPSPPQTPRASQSPSYEVGGDHTESLISGSSPNMVQNAQQQKLTRVQSGEAAVVSVVNRPQSARPRSYDHRTRLRATMNATADDVQSNRHVNSWTHL